MYAARARGDKKPRSLSSAKVQKFCESEVCRSYVEQKSLKCRSVNGPRSLLTPLNIGDFYTFLHIVNGMLKAIGQRPRKLLT